MHQLTTSARNLNNLVQRRDGCVVTRLVVYRAVERDLRYKEKPWSIARNGVCCELERQRDRELFTDKLTNVTTTFQARCATRCQAPSTLVCWTVSNVYRMQFQMLNEAKWEEWVCGSRPSRDRKLDLSLVL